MRHYARMLRAWFARRFRAHAPPIGCPVLFVRVPTSVTMVTLTARNRTRYTRLTTEGIYWRSEN